VDSGFCAVFINTDPNRDCKLILTYKIPENLVIQNGQGNCKTLYLHKNGGKEFVLMRKVDPEKQDHIGPYTYIIRWEEPEKRVSNILAQVVD